eukprot:14151583-Ditylum_brightwellii.AAC.1
MEPFYLDLAQGEENLIFSHFKEFGLSMHIGRNGGSTKTEAVIFAALGKKYKDYDTSNVPIPKGEITCTWQFKYLGPILSWDLNNCPDLENQALQACKALQAMMPNVCCIPTI